MAKHVDVVFGPADKTVMGDTIEEAVKKTMGEILVKVGREPTPEMEAQVRENIHSQQENEKELLKTAFSAYATKVKKDLGTLVECGQLMKKIDQAVGHIELTDHEVGMFKEALPQLDSLNMWVVYVDLLEQLSEPKYKEE
jgi:hypothetical protein